MSRRIRPPQPLAPHGIPGHLVEFVEALRGQGISVGPSETVDAGRVMTVLGLQSRTELREGLACAVLRRADPVGALLLGEEVIVLPIGAVAARRAAGTDHAVDGAVVAEQVGHAVHDVRHALRGGDQVLVAGAAARAGIDLVRGHRHGVAREPDRGLGGGETQARRGQPDAGGGEQCFRKLHGSSVAPIRDAGIGRIPEVRPRAWG